MRQSYRIYLQSDWWLKNREKILKKKKNCEICGSRKDLNIHHKHYSNGLQRNILYKEPDYLLILLCQKCHYLWHSLFGKIKLRKGKIKNIRRQLSNGSSIKEAFLNCNNET